MAPLPATPARPHLEPTSASLDWADLAVIDLSRYDLDRDGLARQVEKAMTTNGFFYVTNHGYPRDRTQRMFDVAGVPFKDVDAEEKVKYHAEMVAKGSYQGYKPRNYWTIDKDVKDQIEHYNINRDVTKRQHPSAVRPFLPEIAAFAKFNQEILEKILTLFSIALGLPPSSLSDIHKYEEEGESYVRFMIYYPRTQDEEAKTNQTWLKGHTDFGSVTLLWSQPIASLQMLDFDDKWRYVKPVDGSLIVNAGDMLEMLSGGKFKATIHRVVQPPQDQQGVERLGYCGMKLILTTVYFTLPCRMTASTYGL